MTDLPDPQIPEPAGEALVTAPSFTAGSHATHHGKRVEITLVHDDQTADVQEIDANGDVVSDENNQPKWTPKVPLGELS